MFVLLKPVHGTRCLQIALVPLASACAVCQPGLNGKCKPATPVPLLLGIKQQQHGHFELAFVLSGANGPS